MNAECCARPFQICGSCKHAWATRTEFILDSAVRLVGLQAVFTNSDFNALVFEHRCGSSISILCRRLRPLLPEAERNRPTAGLLLGTDRCGGHCRTLSDLEACDSPCINARDRKLTLLVQEMKRSAETLRD